MGTPSSARGRTDTPLLDQTIGENLRRTAERHPLALALVSRHQGFRASYAGLWDLTGRAARGLVGRGVARGDRVGIWSPNRWEWVVLQLATARAGAVLVNTARRCGSARPTGSASRCRSTIASGWFSATSPARRTARPS